MSQMVASVATRSVVRESCVLSQRVCSLVAACNVTDDHDQAGDVLDRQQALPH